MVGLPLEGQHVDRPCDHGAVLRQLDRGLAVQPVHHQLRVAEAVEQGPGGADARRVAAPLDLVLHEDAGLLLAARRRHWAGVAGEAAARRVDGNAAGTLQLEALGNEELLGGGPAGRRGLSSPAEAEDVDEPVLP
eukprot:8102789-Lingulodinium_polyedra.AAC.1